MKKISHILICLIISVANVTLAQAQTFDVLIIGSEFSTQASRLQDVDNFLTATGWFGSVDQFNANSATPTFAQLQNYESVLVYSNATYNNPAALGNVLSAYVDAGGGVVLAVFENHTTSSLHIGGSFDNAAYRVLSLASSTTGAATLGSVFQPAHPIMAGVNAFNGGTSSYRINSSSLYPGSGAYKIADWSTGQVMAAACENAGAAGDKKRADINFYPPSNASIASNWHLSTDGARILGNALLWTGNCGRMITTSGPTALCDGIGTVTLTAPAGNSWLWNNGETTQQITVNASGAGTYSVSVDGMASCNSITVTAPPKPVISGMATACPNKQVTLTANTSGSWSWSSGQTTQSISTSGSVSFSRQVSVNGCTSDPFNVTVYPATPVPTVSSNSPLCILSPLNLFSNAGYVSYAWTGPSSFTSSDQNPVRMPPVSGFYRVVVSDNNGCTSTAGTSVIVNSITLYADADGDGFGNPASVIVVCSPQPGYVNNNQDCNDGNANIHPGAVEVCNGFDDNCDLSIDERGIQWQNTIGGTGSDYTSTILQLPDGGYFVGAYSTSNAGFDKSENSFAGTEDFWLVRLDAAGNVLWENTIGSSLFDRLTAARTTSDGGFIVGGTIYCIPTWPLPDGDRTDQVENEDYWIVKLDGSGNIQWQNAIGGSSNDILTDIQTTSDNGFIVAGISGSGISGDKSEAYYDISGDIWVLKLDAGGDIVWQNTIGGYQSDICTSIMQTPDGGYILGAYSSSAAGGDKTESGAGADDLWILKLDASGNITWQNTIGGSYYDKLEVVLPTSDGGYIVGATSGSGISGDKTESNVGGGNDNDFWVLKLDASGSIVWQNTIGGSNGDNLADLCLSADGGYMLAGSTFSMAGGDKTENNLSGNTSFTDDWIVKINASGSVLWQNTLGGTSNDRISDICQTSDGGYILGAWSTSGISGDKTENYIGGGSDLWIVKITPECSAQLITYFRDADLDGYGNPSDSIRALTAPIGYIAASGDCNDQNANVNPAATEICNGIDDDCDGLLDQSDPSVSNMLVVDAGPDESTFYGYSADQVVTHTAVVSGGVPPYTYSWTMNRPLICNAVNASGDEIFTLGNCIHVICPSSGSPTANPACTDSASIRVKLLDTTDVCVTVTDANGCIVTDCFKVMATDARCFAGNSNIGKVKMCHYTGNPNNPWVQICVDEDAVANLIAQGDYVGNCNAARMATDQPELDLYPNPADNSVMIFFNSDEQFDYDILITDITGRSSFVVQGKASSGSNNVEIQTSGLTPGIYFVHFNSNGSKVIRKLQINR